MNRRSRMQTRRMRATTSWQTHPLQHNATVAVAKSIRRARRQMAGLALAFRRLGSSFTIASKQIDAFGESIAARHATVAADAATSDDQSDG